MKNKFYQKSIQHVLQYISLELAITLLRAAKPYNMGSIYWQINDVWPDVSWASVDFYGCWKSGHYAAKRFNNDSILALKLNNSTTLFDLTFVSDIDLNGTIHFQYMSNSGTLLSENVYENVTVSKLKVNQWAQLTLIRKNSPINKVLSISGSNRHKELQSPSCMRVTRSIDQESSVPQITQLKVANQLTLTSVNLVRNIFLGSEVECFNLSDNYFDLVPGESKVNTFNGISQVQLKKFQGCQNARIFLIIRIHWQRSYLDYQKYQFICKYIMISQHNYEIYFTIN